MQPNSPPGEWLNDDDDDDDDDASLFIIRKFLQSLPDKGRKVSETVERLKKLIAQKERIEDTVVQFERLTVSQLVQRTQLDALDSDDSDNNDDDKMHTHSCTGDPASSEHHKFMANKSSNEQYSSQSPGRTWDYESSATPPTYKLEVISTGGSVCTLDTYLDTSILV